MALAQFGLGNSGNPATKMLMGKKHYFDTLAAIHGGIKKIIKANPGPRTIIITKPFFAQYVLEALRIPKKKYHGVSPYGAVPKKPKEIVLAQRYLASLPKRTPKPRQSTQKLTRAQILRKNANTKNRLSKPPVNRRHRP